MLQNCFRKFAKEWNLFQDNNNIAEQVCYPQIMIQKLNLLQIMLRINKPGAQKVDKNRFKKKFQFKI